MTATLGFLTVRRHPEHGFFGGYLIVNALARPLEFHCTMPVQPSRAQELLYGPTLDDFICGEQIAKALTTKARLKPDVIITDAGAVASLALVCDLLVAHLMLTDDAAPSAPLFQPPRTQAKESPRAVIGAWHFALPHQTSDAEERLRERLASLPAEFDLVEPFHRVVDALLEAHPIARAA